MCTRADRDAADVHLWGRHAAGVRLPVDPPATDSTRLPVLQAHVAADLGAETAQTPAQPDPAESIWG